jgi:hypothetical protein
MISVHDLNSIKETAKSRKNGVFTKCGYAYVVIDNEPRYLMDFHGNVAEIYGGFTVALGKVDIYPGNYLKELKKLSKENKWV